MKSNLIIFIIVVITILALIFFIDVNNDKNNCGMVENKCEQGFICRNATCVLP